jgi:hypothetical protein
MAGITVTRTPGGITNVTEVDPLADLPELDPTRVIKVFDDFVNVLNATTSSTLTWGDVNDGGTGTNAFQDATGGVYNVVTAAVDNDYHAMVTQHETFKFTTGKKAWFKARVKLSEATALESTWWVGVTDDTTTGGMQINALGPLASYDGALFYKTPETAMTLNFETSNAGAQVTSAAMVTSVTNTWTTVAFHWDGAGKVYPFIAVNDSNDLVPYPSHTLSATGLEEMHVVFGVKAGPTAAAETLQVDFILMAQER